MELSMSQSTMAETTPTLPADVIAYAAEHGVEQFLLPHLEITKRHFPSARRIMVVLEEDPEIANMRYIVYWVEVSGLGVSQAVEAHHAWVRDSLQCCSPPIDSPFVLHMDLGK
jgi:hypothetical protein